MQLTLISNGDPAATFSFWAHACRWQRLALVVLLVLAAGYRWLGIIHTNPTAVVNMPLPDDAFYYLTLARNAAAGQGLTISADGTPTNGFQPLWGLLLIGLQAMLDGPQAPSMLTVAQLNGAVLGMLTGLLVLELTLRLSGRPGIALLAAACLLLSPQVLKHQLNGMETSLATLAGLLILALHLAVSRWARTAAGAGLAGLVTGLALLSRLDMVVLLAACWAVLVLVSRPKLTWPGLSGYLAGMSLPWLAWTWLAASQGVGPLPESGSAVRNLTLMVRHLPARGLIESLSQQPALFIPFYASNLLEFSSAWIRQTPVLLPVTLPVFAAAGIDLGVQLSALLGVLVLMLAFTQAWRRRQSVEGRAWAIWLLFTIGASFAYSLAVLGPWFYQRYAAPLAVIANVLILTVIGRSTRQLALRPWLTGGLAAAILAGFVALISAGSYRWVAVGPAAVADDGFYRAAAYIDDRLPPGTRVGVFSAGLISYYADQPIIPLDGKVHRGARQALAEGRMLEFLCRTNVEYLLDWEQMIGSLAERRSEAWQPGDLTPVAVLEVEAYNDLALVRIEPAACQRVAGGGP